MVQSAWGTRRASPILVTLGLLLVCLADGFHVTPLPVVISPRLSRRLMHRPAPLSCSASTTSARSAEEAILALVASSGTKGRGTALTAEQQADVHRLATELEESASTGDDTNASPLLPGRWRVLYQGKPGGEKTEFFSAESWKKYLSGDGMQNVPHRICTAFAPHFHA
jgi:hypothetical protein